jgi:hypothetical protein
MRKSELLQIISSLHGEMVLCRAGDKMPDHFLAIRKLAIDRRRRSEEEKAGCTVERLNRVRSSWTVSETMGNSLATL